MKCIICGEKDSVERGLCEDCLFKSVSITFDASEDIVICPKCGGIKIGKRWHYRNREREMQKRIESKINLRGIDGKTASVSFNDFDMAEDDKIEFEAEIESSTGLKHIFPGEVHLKKLLNSCPECNKKTGSYYEAIVQIRSSFGEYDNSIDEVVSEAIAIENNLEKEHNNSFISKIEKKPEGIDIYLGRKTDAAQIAKAITDRRPSSLIVTKSLVGRREGEDFNRYTYGIRILGLTEGSVISMRDGTFIVRSIHKENTRLLSTETGKEKIVKSETLFRNDYRVLERKIQKRKFIVVSRNDEEAEVMDPENFKISTIRGKFSGNEIELYSYDGHLY
jgi:nonsense-mediated mRNA decay protein 3